MIVSLSDSGMKQPAGPALHPTTQQMIVNSRAILGDMLALVSALFYAMYVILLKVRIKSESRIDMQLFFGFVGLLNIIACWPIGFILHITGAEVFELPTSRKALSALFINVRAMESQYIYVFIFPFTDGDNFIKRLFICSCYAQDYTACGHHRIEFDYSRRGGG
jgi:solute carrier family 35 protein F5